MLDAEFSKALDLLEKLDTDVPRDPRLAYGRAVCLFMLGRSEEAGDLCEDLSRELKDSRGQRLQAAFLAAARQADSSALPEPGTRAGAPPAFRRRRWPWVAAFLAVVLINLSMWSAYPVLLRLQGQGGQLPNLSAEEPQAVFTTPNAQETPAPTEPASDNANKEIGAPGPNGAKTEPVSALADANREMGAPGPNGAQTESVPVSPETQRSAGAGGQPQGNGPPPATPATNTAQESPVAAADASSGLLADTPGKPAWKLRLEGLQLPAAPKGPVPSVVELQPYRTLQTLANDKGDSVKLTNLNPLVGSWYVLEYAVGGKKQAFHLEVFPLAANDHEKPKLSLYADGLAVILKKDTQYFPLWAEPGKGAGKTAAEYETTRLNAAPALSDVFKTMAAARTPVGLLCNNMVLVRQQRPGSTSRIELATDILRETRVGDWLVEKLKPMLIRAPEVAENQAGRAAVPGENSPESPVDALVAPSFAKLAHKPKLLNIATAANDQNMSYGRWYKTVQHPGVYVSVLTPSAIAPAILASYPDRVDPFGGSKSGIQESGSVVYMLAIDMDRYGFGYAIGADHPNVEWSVKVKKTPGMDGPDGFGTRAPLATIGALPPYLVDKVEGVFAAGFKREHGAFAFGPFSKINNSSHFGFVENGVVFSRLNPGLATAVIGPDGTMDLLTWPENGDQDFRYIVHARQNGVPLIDGIDANGVSIPGELVNNYGEGAWSGSANGRLLTIRTGMGIQEHDGHRFLLLGYFTGATPNAMARAYQAYQCRYAMTLDMNAPELCYSALYCRGGDGKIAGAEYLIKEMSAANGGNHLRFLQTNDTRDCFYLFHK